VVVEQGGAFAEEAGEIAAQLVGVACAKLDIGKLDEGVVHGGGEIY